MSKSTNREAAADSDTGADEVTFETSLAALEQIVHGLEDGQQGLGKSLQLYEQGIQHLQRCYQLLDDAEQKIELLTGVDDEGRAVTQPFDSTSGDLAEKTGTRSRKRAPRGE
jgi:exodeoxyribonuclease VII small subunit